MPVLSGLNTVAAGFVLAGGQSTRMGTNKALVEFRGRPLTAHAIGIVIGAGLPVSIAGIPGPEPTPESLYAPVIADRESGLGPLGGVCVALTSTAAEFGVFVPVDLPFLPSSLLAYLVHHARVTDAAVTLASVNGLPQTFPAVLSRRALPVLENELRCRRLGCLKAFQAAARELGESVLQLPTEVLAQAGQISHCDALPVARWFLNFNTPQDVELALSLRAARLG
jgi:molybdenum cofactor guanylyltransferase